MDRKAILQASLLVAMAGLIAVVAIIRANRSHAPTPKPQRAHVSTPPPLQTVKNEEPEPSRPKPETNPAKLPAALHDATLKGLIQNAKVAHIRGDSKTRDAMVLGLKKQPERSKELIQKEIATSRDYDSATALQKLMEALQ